MKQQHEMAEGHMYQFIDGALTEVVRRDEGLVPIWHPAAKQLAGQLALKLEFDYVPFEVTETVNNREIKL